MTVAPRDLAQPVRRRVLEVELSNPAMGGVELRVQRSEFQARDPAVQLLGDFSGPALGVALLLDRARTRGDDAPAGEGPFVLAVGDLVRRGFPTAARATVLGRSPVTGRLAEGQVGSDLGRRLARVADALLVRGETRRPGAVLVIDGLTSSVGSETEGVRLLECPELVGADARTTARRLRERLGPGAFLRVGPAGERGLPMANLAAGSDEPSFVGRGGLGAVLGRIGLKAIAILAEPVPDDPDSAGALHRALATSPRLAARSLGGTLELAHAFAARGSLFDAEGQPLDAAAGERLSEEARRAGQTRHGCRGCPTPCGWVFERSEGPRQTAHFSAIRSLGTELGFEDFDSSLALLAACDRVGVDAKDIGAALVLLARSPSPTSPESPANTRAAETRGPDDESASGVRFGDLESMLAAIDGLATGAPGSAQLALGAAGLAERHRDADAARLVDGQVAREETDLAALLGQCVGLRGAEPMRTFPFLATDGVTREALVARVAPLALPTGAEDPLDSRGKGRLVGWHENLVAAVDSTGFCAFSAAGLLADGSTTLDELATWIAPHGVEWPGLRGASPGERLLSVGATRLLLGRELEREWGAPASDTPGWAAARLAQPGMAAEYRRYRGLDSGGWPTPAAVAALGTTALLEFLDGAESATTARSRPGSGRASAAPSDEQPRHSPAAGRVSLHASGPLGELLGGGLELQLDLPAPLARVLAAAIRERPELAGALSGSNGPVVYREGSRVGPGDAVADGERLDLIQVVSGG